MIHPDLIAAIDDLLVDPVVDAGKKAARSRGTPIQRRRDRLYGVFPHHTLDSTPSNDLALFA